MTKHWKQENLGIFSLPKLFWELEQEKKKSEGIPVVLVENLIEAPQMPIFAEGTEWLHIKCWVASNVSVNGHAIKALEEPLSMSKEGFHQSK